MLFVLFICGAQEKSYRFVYDFHQQVVLNEESRNGYAKEFVAKIQDAFNESYEFDLVASKDFSFLKLRDKVKNGQTEGIIKIEPDLKWFLIDFSTNETYNFMDQGNAYIKDSIETLQLKPTRNKKTILGIETREFTAETDDFYYSFWLTQQNGITVSPIQYQFKGYIVVEVDLVHKLLPNEDGKMEQQFILKEIKEEKSVFNFKKLKPKKTMTKKQFQEFLDKADEIDDNSLDRE